MAQETPSVDRIISIVRDILQDADLGEMTGKMVREKVIGVLGEQAGGDMRAFKAAVKTALNAVLMEQQNNSDDADADADAHPSPLQRNAAQSSSIHRRNKENSDSKYVSTSVSGVSVKKMDTNSSFELANILAPSNPEDDDDDDDDFQMSIRRKRNVSTRNDNANHSSAASKTNVSPSSRQQDEELEGSTVEKKIHRRARPKRVKEDDDYVEEDEEEEIVKSRGRRRKHPKLSEDNDSLDEDNSRPEYTSVSSPADVYKGDQLDASSPPPDTSIQSAKVAGTPPSSSHSSHSLNASNDISDPSRDSPVHKRARPKRDTAEKRLEKLRAICKQIGVKIPPVRLRSKSATEKCAAVLSVLRAKGVKEDNPLSLNRRQIAVHKERLEKEKELAGLDVGNIIKEEGRPRRRKAAPITIQPEQDELPSDFSGAELEEADESEEESEEYQAASSQDSE